MAWDRSTSSGLPTSFAAQRPDSFTTTTQGPQTTTTQGNINSQTDSFRTSQEQSQSINMDPAALAALNALIQQLMGGGTQAMAQDKAKRQQEVQYLQGQRAGYSKEAAFSDAQGAMNALLQRALEEQMPTLVRSAEGAGTSANSMRALLTQNIANKAAESAALLGLQTASSYGGVATGMSNTLERLLAVEDPVTQALINALNVAKGATTSTTKTGTETGTQTQNQTSNQTQQNSGYTQTQNTSYGGGGSYSGNSGFSSTGSSGGSLSGYNPSGVNTGLNWDGTDALMSVLDDNYFSGYTGW